MVEQLRRGIETLLNRGGAAGVLRRRIMIDNGHGGCSPSDVEQTLPIFCLVSYERGGVYHGVDWEGGLYRDETPYLAARHNADVQRDDLLLYGGKRCKVGTVSRPQLGGDSICTQAALTEVV
jgi:hypothetical protein